LLEPRSIEAVETSIAIGANGNEANVAEDAKVLTGRWLAEPQKCAEVSRTALTRGTELKQSSSGWMRQGDEGPVD
jgi:hypothetical protein